LFFGCTWLSQLSSYFPRQNLKNPTITFLLPYCTTYSTFCFRKREERKEGGKKKKITNQQNRFQNIDGFFGS